MTSFSNFTKLNSHRFLSLILQNIDFQLLFHRIIFIELPLPQHTAKKKMLLYIILNHLEKKFIVFNHSFLFSVSETSMKTSYNLHSKA